MASNPQGPELLFGRESIYRGWDDYYQDGDDGASWGTEPPPFVRDALAAHLTKEGRSVADFGCGDGRNSLEVGRWGHRLTLVDISQGGLDRARHRAIALDLPQIPTLVRADLENLPLADAQFDFALCIDALPQVHRPRQALAEIARTLAPGALLVVNVFTPADCAFNEGERLTARTFLYKNALFNFFEDEEFRPLLDGLFRVVESHHVRWNDPPHIPFRPYPHTHDALVYVLAKQ
jgi:SAM-dependent methyltransferase